MPGAGRGHDALAIGQAGWVVTALDFAESLRARLAERMAGVGGTVVIGDAFGYKAGPFDLVFDHTFFCAIEPDRRPLFGALVDRVTRPGTRLVSVVFPIGRAPSQSGPPWGVLVEDITRALSSVWTLTVDEPAIDPPGREWPARWAEWERG